MAKIRKAVSARKTVNTFVRLRSISKECYDRAMAEESGRTLMISASMLFSAFTFEAFLNHIGSTYTNLWEFVDRLSPKNKLQVLANIKGFRVDFGSRPFQTVARMFRLRDMLAHGKTQEVHEGSVQRLEEHEKPRLPMTKWEKEINPTNAKRYLEDTYKAMVIICEQFGIDQSELFVGSTHELVARPC